MSNTLQELGVEVVPADGELTYTVWLLWSDSMQAGAYDLDNRPYVAAVYASYEAAERDLPFRLARAALSPQRIWNPTLFELAVVR